MRRVRAECRLISLRNFRRPQIMKLCFGLQGTAAGLPSRTNPVIALGSVAEPRTRFHSHAERPVAVSGSQHSAATECRIGGKAAGGLEPSPHRSALRKVLKRVKSAFEPGLRGSGFIVSAQTKRATRLRAALRNCGCLRSTLRIAQSRSRVKGYSFVACRSKSGECGS